MKYAVCGGSLSDGTRCVRMLYFSSVDSTVYCHACETVRALLGAVPEYKTVMLRAVQVVGENPVDTIISKLATWGWIVDQMQVVKEPNADHVLLVYLMKRLVAAAHPMEV